MSYSHVTDDEQFRNVIIWVEEKVIRCYKIEDRAGLRSQNHKTFESSLKKVEKYAFDCSSNDTIALSLSSSSIGMSM